MKIEVRIKYRDRRTGETYVSGTIPLSRAIRWRDSGTYQDAVIVRDEPGWPTWEERKQEDR